MRNNPYHKNLKEHVPLIMQGPSSTTALISNEGQKNFIEEAMKLPDPKQYQVKGVSFTMVRPPIWNPNLTINPSSIINVEMGQTEVTQELFQAVMGWNDSFYDYNLQNPVENVTWYDCISFCNKLSNLLGFEECYRMSDIKIISVHIKKAEVQWDENKNGFRLPTSSEWEFFAKAGTDNQWSGTNNKNNLDEYAWYDKNSNQKTHPVGEKLPNEWGLYDMTGNVWEWCWDPYDSTNTEWRGLRGGCSWDYADGCWVARRDVNVADRRCDYQGFRLCRSLG